MPHKQEYDHAKQVEEARKYELQLSGGQLTYASPPPPRDDESENFEHLDMVGKREFDYLGGNYCVQLSQSCRFVHAVSTL